jgi:DNA-binding GntR family transcriptional regulator
VAKSSANASRVAAAVTTIRDGIFQGRFAPGSALRELTLAREMNVSQATVREALQRLEHAGLVTRKPNIGSTVTRLSPKDIRERVDLRATLEITAAEAAASRMTETDFVELERRLAVLGAAVESDKYYEAAQADLEFHRYVWQCSGNEMLFRLLELVAVPLFAFISILRSQGLQRLTAVVDAHSPLIEALRSRDRDRIRSAFRQGATSSYQAFVGEPTGERNLALMFGFLDPAGEVLAANERE